MVRSLYNISSLLLEKPSHEDCVPKGQFFSLYSTGRYRPHTLVVHNIHISRSHALPSSPFSPRPSFYAAVPHLRLCLNGPSSNLVRNLLVGRRQARRQHLCRLLLPKRPDSRVVHVCQPLADAGEALRGALVVQVVVEVVVDAKLVSLRLDVLVHCHGFPTPSIFLRVLMK
jgi:hypothetical protein